MSRRRRALVTLLVASTFLVLAGSGAVLFLWKHAHRTAAIHTSFGALLLIAVTLHVRNNFRALAIHAAGRPPRRPTRELAITLVPVGLLFLGMCHEVHGLSALYDWGNQRRSRQENRREDRQVHQYLETNAGAAGPAFELHVTKGAAASYPLYAVWIEDEEGRFVETLYLSQGIAKSRLLKEVDGEWVPGEVRRPEALPYWGHRRGLRARDGYFLPDAAHPVADAVTGATPTESWHLTTRTSARHTRFTIHVEVNQSFDWNQHFPEDGFPDDPIYSGSGKVGQPSVVYAAEVDLASPTRYYALNPVGHGHHSGADGRLDPDLSTLTTALDIVDGILLEVVRP